MIEDIRTDFVSRYPELSWVWEVLEGRQLPETERFAALSLKQLRGIQELTGKLRAADRSGSPMAMLAVEKLTGNLLSGESVKPDKYFCSDPARGKRTGTAAGITLLIFAGFIALTVISMLHWNAYLGCACFVAGIITLAVGTHRTDRLFRKDLPQYLSETYYHTDRLYFMKGYCYLLSDKLLFSYCREDRYPARYRDDSYEDAPEFLSVPLADISYIEGQRLILSNGGAISLYDSPQLADMLEYISAVIRWAPAPYHPSKESENSYVKHDKLPLIKLAIAVAMLLVGVYSMPSVVSLIQELLG